MLYPPDLSRQAESYSDARHEEEVWFARHASFKSCNHQLPRFWEANCSLLGHYYHQEQQAWIFIKEKHLWVTPLRSPLNKLKEDWTFYGHVNSTLCVSSTSPQESVGVLSVHFVMPWFLTLFTSLPCWDSVLAVWDLIILHGRYTPHTLVHINSLTRLLERTVVVFIGLFNDLTSRAGIIYDDVLEYVQ